MMDPCGPFGQNLWSFRRKYFEKFIYWWSKAFAFLSEFLSEFEIYIGFIFLLESIILGKLQKSIGRSFEISRATDPVAQALFGYDEGQSSVINLYIHSELYIYIHLLWDLCNWWLIHVKQIQSWHGPSLITCLVSHTTTYHIPSDIYYGPKGGNFEYQGFDGRNIENWTFLSYSLIDSRVRARSHRSFSEIIFGIFKWK